MRVGENIGRHINGNTENAKKEEPARFERKERKLSVMLI